MTTRLKEQYHKTMWLPVQFDLSILTLEHISLFAAGFIVLYGLISLFVSRSYPWLRVAARRHGVPIYYGGVLWLGTATLLAYLAIDDPSARLGLVGAAFLALIVGIVDENKRLSPAVQLLWQVAIAAIAVTWGWSIITVSSLAGDSIVNLDLFRLGPLIIPGGIITVAWLLLLMNAVNWLDGVDGLAAGVGTVTFITLAAISLLPQIHDSETLSLAVIGAGSLLAFLIWNFPPARIYLGTTGSWFLGLFIGLTAIASGGKIVTTLLVLALPVADLIVVVVQRLLRRQPPWQGDTTHHLHHRLLNAGLSARAITLGAIGVSLLLGLVAISVQTHQKIIVLALASLLLLLLTIRLAIVQSTQPSYRKP